MAAFNDRNSNMACKIAADQQFPARAGFNSWEEHCKVPVFKDVEHINSANLKHLYTIFLVPPCMSTGGIHVLVVPRMAIFGEWHPRTISQGAND